MTGQLEGLCSQLPFNCALPLVSVFSQNKFEHNEVTTVYNGEHCGHWCTLESSSLRCGTINTELVWIFFYSLDCVH